MTFSYVCIFRRTQQYVVKTCDRVKGSRFSVSRRRSHSQLCLDILERLPLRPVHRSGVSVRRLELDVPAGGGGGVIRI